MQVVSTSGQPVTVKDGETFYTLYTADNVVYEGYLTPVGHTEEFQFISDKVYKVTAMLAAGTLVTACDMPGYTAIVCPAEGQLSTVWPMNNTEKVMILGELDDTDMTTIRGHNNITDLLLMDVTEIGTSALNYCTNLVTVNLPKAKSIGNGAFLRCSKLTTVSLPEATSIENAAFIGCRALTTVNLPQATSIGNMAFYSDSELSNISLPLATNIGNNAFGICIKLTRICLPKNVQLGNTPFTNCIALTTLFLSDTDATERDAEARRRHLANHPLRLHQRRLPLPRQLHRPLDQTN